MHIVKAPDIEQIIAITRDGVFYGASPEEAAHRARQASEVLAARQRASALKSRTPGRVKAAQGTSVLARYVAR